MGFHCECERASLATCALSSHPHYRYSILPMLIILVGCVILFRRTTSYFQISIMILQPYEDDWYLILRLSGWGARWRRSREVRGNGRSNLHAMEHECVSDATCQNIGSFLERANRAWGLLNWHWELMMASPWHRSRTAHLKACIFGVCKQCRWSHVRKLKVFLWGLKSAAH